MASGVRGDFSGLAKLRERIAQMATPAFRAEAAQVLAASALKMVADTFRKQTDPYGKAWAPFSKKTRRKRGKMDRAKLLQDTGRLKSSIGLQYKGPDGFRIGTNVEYAAVHQFGGTVKAHETVLKQHATTGRFVPRAKTGLLNRVKVPQYNIPRRSYLPLKDQGLPPEWRRVFARDLVALVRRKVEKKAA